MLNHFVILSNRSPRHTPATTRTAKAPSKPRKGTELEAAESETNPAKTLEIAGTAM